MDQQACGLSPRAGRRGRALRRFGLLAGIAGAIATLGACAQQGPMGDRADGARPMMHGHGHGGHGPMSAEDMSRRIDRMVERVLSDVDATPEQKQKVSAIAKQAAVDLAPLRDSTRAARRQGIELLAASAVDRAALERLRTTQLQSMDQASRRMTQALADIAEVLTPEQRAKLRARMEQRMQRRWG